MERSAIENWDVSIRNPHTKAVDARMPRSNSTTDVYLNAMEGEKHDRESKGR